MIPFCLCIIKFINLLKKSKIDIFLRKLLRNIKHTHLDLLIIIDVARPDRISGADINAICQEVCFFFNMQSTSTPHAGVV